MLRKNSVDEMRDVYIVQCLMETDLYKLLKSQVSETSFKQTCFMMSNNAKFSNVLCYSNNFVKDFKRNFKEFDYIVDFADVIGVFFCSSRDFIENSVRVSFLSYNLSLDEIRKKKRINEICC